MSTPKKKLKVKRAKPLIQQLPDSGNYEDGNSKFARALASNDYQTRAKGLEALTRWLSRKSEVSQQDMLKIWKSLYYCFWHSDKAPVQEDLAVTLAKVQLELSAEVAFTYYAAFVETMRREWFGIDRHRLDKFLLLVRHFLAHLFCLFRTHQWDLTLVQRYTRHMEQHVLLPSDSYKAAGFSYHLADIFLPELLKEAAKAPPPSPSLEALFEPFAEAMCHCPEASALNRYRESVFSVVVEEVHSPGEGAPLGQLAVQALSDALFGLGAQPGVVARNRDVLYSTSKALEKAARKRAKMDQEAAGAGAAGAPEPQQKGKKKKKQQQQQQEEQQEQQQEPLQEVTPPHTSTTKKRKKQQAGADSVAATTTTATASPALLETETPVEPSPSDLAPKSTKRTRSKSATPAAALLNANGTPNGTSNGTPNGTPNGTTNGTPLYTPLQTPIANHISDPTPLGNHLFAGHTPAHIPPTTSTHPTTKSSKRKKDWHVAFQTPLPATTPERPANPTPCPAATPLPLSPVQPDFSTPNGASPAPPGHTPYASSHPPPTTGPAGSTPAAIPATRSHHKKKATALLFGTPTPSPQPSTPPPAQPTPPSPAATPAASGPSDFQFQTPVTETPDTPTLLKGGRPGSTPNPLKRKSASTAAGSEATPQQNGSGRMKTRKSSTPAKSAGPSSEKKKKVVINLRRNQEFAHGSPAPQGTPIPQPKGILKHNAAMPNSAPPKSTAPSRTENGKAKPFLTPNKKNYPKAATFFQ